jgi:hypothetical protein
LEDTILAYGRQVYLLETLAPGATIRVEIPSDRNRSLSGFLKDKQKANAANKSVNRESRIDRADLMLAVMFHDSESTLASERVLANDPLQNIDLTGQLALRRPMLVARINRPGSKLVLDNAPSPPKIDQTTLVRLILPLKKARL